MTAEQFTRLASASPLQPGRTLDACRLVLVDGLSPAEAARQAGVEHSAVSRALPKIPRKLCRACGQPV